MQHRVHQTHTWTSSVQLASDTLAQTWQKYTQNRRVRLRNLLVEHYLAYAVATSERFCQGLPRGVGVDETISAGVAGLTATVESFNPGCGVKFETYCYARIHGAIRDALRQSDWLPRSLRRDLRHWQSARDQLHMRLGRPPETGELADSLGLSRPECEALARHARITKLTSLDATALGAGRDQPVPQRDLVADDRVGSPAGRFQAADLKRLITRGCTDAERQILILYYFEKTTMREIGLVLGMTESRVSQLHHSVIGRLRTNLAGREREFLPLEN